MDPTPPPSRVFGSVVLFYSRRDKFTLWDEKLQFFHFENGVIDEAQQNAMLPASNGMTLLIMFKI